MEGGMDTGDLPHNKALRASSVPESVFFLNKKL
jgi:hypothetical protein